MAKKKITIKIEDRLVPRNPVAKAMAEMPPKRWVQPAKRPYSRKNKKLED